MGLDRGTKVERRAVANLDEIEFGEKGGFQEYPSSDLAPHHPQAVSDEWRAQQRCHGCGSNGLVQTIHHFIQPDITAPERLNRRLEFAHHQLLENSRQCDSDDRQSNRYARGKKHDRPKRHCGVGQRDRGTERDETRGSD